MHERYQTNSSWVKIKKKDINIYELVVIEQTRERGEVLVKTSMHPNGRPVGVKICNKDKKGLNIGDQVAIEHQGITVNGSLRHPVFKGKV